MSSPGDAGDAPDGSAAAPAGAPHATEAPSPPDGAPASGADRIDFPVVGIGASAGGLEALQAMLRRLKHDNMSFVVVQHLSPVHESMLTELLGRATRLHVTTIQDGEIPERNRIYVLPANADLELRAGTFRLRHASRAVPRLPIDRFFRSLASELGQGAIGVLLSGGGSDGTLGLQSIKAEGGITFAQDPGTAIQPSMPQSAIDAGCADFCLSPEDIGRELMRVSAYVARPGRRPPAGGLDPDGLAKIFSQLRAAFRVDFTQYKHSTLERRMERRMAVHRLDSLEAYLKFIDQSPGELDTLYRDLLIGVTSFFRDREMFDAMKAVVLPRIFERRPADPPVRVWVAGCSTGEEAYSVAIAMVEHLGDRMARCKVQIFATDLDEDAVRQARHGLYRSSIELDVSSERLERFFSARTNDEYQISRPIRDMVVFATQDLSRDPPFSRVDLVCCRNVLIYMQPPLQKKVLRICHYALNPEGFMILGSSESVGDGSELFAVVDRKLKIYVKKNSPASAAFDFAFGGHRRPDEERAPVHEARPTLSLQQIADRKVMERFAPPGVVINEALEILQFRGRTGGYLEPAPGTATLNILKLARPELLMELRAIIHKALEQGYAVESAPIHIKAEKGYWHVVLEAMPLQDAAVTSRCMLILFREFRELNTLQGRATAVAALAEAAEAAAPEDAKDPRVVALERDLSSTKDYLQTTIEELETADDELKSANEELQSSNEELQSTNEELETSKEELQSTNEELATVNEELRSRMSEFGAHNDDLANVLGIVDNPVVLVGMDLRIRRFSQSAETQCNLVAGDVGRPVGHLKSFLQVPDLEQTLGEVVHRMSIVRKDVATADGRRYRLRIVPYKTAGHAIRGTILELVPLDPRPDASRRDRAELEGGDPAGGHGETTGSSDGQSPSVT